MTNYVYYAKLDHDGIVERVQVTTRAFIDANPDRYPGTWVETSDPYTDQPTEVAYCGPGYGHDPDWPCQFAPVWMQPTGADTERPPYPAGHVAWHDGHLWVSTLDGNVWVPGQSGWRRTPTVPGQPPVWTQPSGAHDVWNAGEHVTFEGDVWRSDIDNNVWAPGVHGWTRID